MDRSPRPIAASPVAEPENVKWLALVLAETFRVFLALVAKRYPEARGRHICEKCGYRS